MEKARSLHPPVMTADQGKELQSRGPATKNDPTTHYYTSGARRSKMRSTHGSSAGAQPGNFLWGLEFRGFSIDHGHIFKHFKLL